MEKGSIKAISIGFIGGIAFIAGCGAGNSSVANNQYFMDIEEKYCTTESSGPVGDAMRVALLAKKTLKEHLAGDSIYCSTLASDTLETTTLDELYANGWKTTNAVHASNSERFKLWRYVTPQ